MKKPAYRFAYGNYAVALYNETESVNAESLYENVYDSTEEGYRPSLKVGIRLVYKSSYVGNCLISADGGVAGIHKNTVFVNNSTLWICCGSWLYKFSLPDLELLWAVKADAFTCFGIYPYEDDCIVHGELEISRVSSQGEILWRQGGVDIWTTIDGNNDFEIQEDCIQAVDWENNWYTFDFNGNLI